MQTDGITLYAERRAVMDKLRKDQYRKTERKISKRKKRQENLRYYLSHKEDVLERVKKYAGEYPEYRKNYLQKWEQDNKEKRNEYKRNWRRQCRELKKLDR